MQEPSGRRSWLDQRALTCPSCRTTSQGLHLEHPRREFVVDAVCLTRLSAWQSTRTWSAFSRAAEVVAYIFVDAAPSTTDPSCSYAFTTLQARSPAPSDQRCWRLLSSHRVPLVRGKISSTDSPMTSHVYRRRVDELAPTLARTESTGGHSHGDHRLDKVASIMHSRRAHVQADCAAPCVRVCPVRACLPGTSKCIWAVGFKPYPHATLGPVLRRAPTG